MKLTDLFFLGVFDWLEPCFGWFFLLSFLLDRSF